MCTRGQHTKLKDEQQHTINKTLAAIHLFGRLGCRRSRRAGIGERGRSGRRGRRGCLGRRGRRGRRGSGRRRGRRGRRAALGAGAARARHTTVESFSSLDRVAWLAWLDDPRSDTHSKPTKSMRGECLKHARLLLPCPSIPPTALLVLSA